MENRFGAGLNYYIKNCSLYTCQPVGTSIIPLPYWDNIDRTVFPRDDRGNDDFDIPEQTVM